MVICTCTGVAGHALRGEVTPMSPQAAPGACKQDEEAAEAVIVHGGCPTHLGDHLGAPSPCEPCSDMFMGRCMMP